MHIKYALLTKCQIKMAQAWSVKDLLDLLCGQKENLFFATKKVKDSY